jgi:2-C-methyl-D-erythritol 4-phosphate cytidylyltransferase
MNNKVYAIITAAGSGIRFGGYSKDAKPRIPSLLGKPVILYSMRALQKCTDVNEIIISANKEYFEYLHTLAVKNKITKLNGFAEGGSTRFESVRNAFEQIERKSSDLVLIHDAVRPNINSALIENLLREADKSGEVIVGLRIIETVKRSNKGYVSEHVNRDNLWAVQTPQVFRYKVLKDAYVRCGKKNDFTDESSLVEYAGYKVKITEGARDNIKITTPEDIKLLKKLMK